MNNIIQQQKILTHLWAQYWLKNEVFTLTWWILLTITVLPWFLWWKYVDKKRITHIFLYGLCVVVIVTLLDILGRNRTLWTYWYELQPLTPHLEVADYTILPITYMMIYQYFAKWKSFLLVDTCFSLISSFIIEPTAVWLGIYSEINWKHIYSFPIYILIGIVCKLATDKLISIEAHHKTI